jgi:diacylglycerol kinase family enzyme
MADQGEFDPKYLIRNSHAGTGGLPDELFDGFTLLNLDGIADVLTCTGLHPLVAVWGGDGTSRSVAKVAVNSDVVMLPCPGGTHNHYAKAAGFPSPDEVANALERPIPTRVDVGFVNNELFLNNLSIGWYADLVARRERYEKQMPRRLAKILSVIMHLGTIRPLHVTVDGTPERVWMFWVGNGKFSGEPGKLLQRHSLTDGVLDVRLLRVGTGSFPKFRALCAVLGRRVESSKLIQQRIATACTVEFRNAAVDVALDGELLNLKTPLHVRSNSQSLTILSSLGADADNG